jgi:hypothetical protein
MAGEDVYGSPEHLAFRATVRKFVEAELAPRAPTARSRAGRPRVYGPAVAAAVEVLWQATGHIGPHRLHPFLPELLDRLTRDGALTLPPELDKLVRHVSPATLGRGSNQP